ncbi:MAG: alkaline phosphatase family protein [Bacteroidota bacterium]
MSIPDYHGGSIVNLMASLTEAVGGNAPAPYPPLRGIDTGAWRASRSVVLLVIDGLGDELVRGTQGAFAQHRAGRLTSVFPSTTATAVTTFLTGLAPQQHGLTGWNMYFRELGSVLSVLPFVTRAGKAPLGKGVDAAELLGASGLSARLPVRMHVVSPRRIIHSDFNVAHTDGARRHGFDTLAEMFQILAQLVREGGAERRYLYAYWPELDHLAHEHGIGSRAAAAHLAELDGAFGEFLRRIEGADATVVVTGDHGIVDSEPGQLVDLDAHPRLTQMLQLPLCGERRVPYCYVKPGQGAAFEDYVANELADYVECHASAALIDRGYFGLGAPHPRLAERVGHYTLIMKDRYVMKDSVPGDHWRMQVGVHGGTSEAEMHVPLIVTRV